jgi:hypothetical protein
MGPPCPPQSINPVGCCQTDWLGTAGHDMHTLDWSSSATPWGQRWLMLQAPCCFLLFLSLLQLTTR